LKDIFYRVIAVLYIAFVFITSFFFFDVAIAIWVVTRLFDRRLRLLHRFTCLWASLYIWIFPPWRVTVHGKEKIDPDKTYVIVSNHQSLVDILVAFMTFAHFKWVSKSELFNIPLIGWNMYLNRYIKLERGRSRSIRHMYDACEKHLREGSSIYVFPEGTRSPSGMLRPFKEGAFVLAKRMGVPVLPLVINGSKNALPKASLNFHGGSDVHLEVLDEIPPESFKDMPTAELADMVRELIRVRVAEEADS
jgi:1-acyl-sn-glycerol-3-phosphate acyltransferase